MLAAQMYGQEWENQILSGRMDILEDFKNSYIAIQKDIVKYAWWATEEQKKAAEEAVKGANADLGKRGDAPDANNSTSSERIYKIVNADWDVIRDGLTEKEANEELRNLQKQGGAFGSDLRIETGNPKYKIVNNRGTTLADDIDSEDAVARILEQLIGTSGKLSAGLRIEKYHTGGVVGGDDPYKDYVLLEDIISGKHKLKDEQLAVLKKREYVLNPVKAGMVTDYIRGLELLPHPNYFKNSIPQAIMNRETTNHPVTNHITINCPNVTNNSGVEYLNREMNKWLLASYQEKSRR